MTKKRCVWVLGTSLVHILQKKFITIFTCYVNHQSCILLLLIVILNNNIYSCSGPQKRAGALESRGSRPHTQCSHDVPGSMWAGVSSVCRWQIWLTSKWESPEG